MAITLYKGALCDMTTAVWLAFYYTWAINSDLQEMNI